MRHFPRDRPLRPLVVACVVFLLAAAAATSMIRHSELHNREEERTRISDLADDNADALQRNLERAMSVTYALGALVRQGHGAISDFDAVGRQMLPYYPGVSSLSLAPAGIIRSVVPLAGNEKAIGQDLLNNPATKKEASLAQESGKLTLTGPFTLVQGDIAVVGRLPIFLNDTDAEPRFWGFINAVIRLHDAIEAAGFPKLAARGIDYKLWRIQPDTGRTQIIAASSSTALIDPVEHKLKMPYGTWTLSAAPVKGWGNLLGLSLTATLGLVFSLLLGYVAKLLVEARGHERRLEALVVQRTAEVRAREADLHRAQSVARVGSWVFDFSSEEFHGSTEALRIFGMSASGRFDMDILVKCVHPDDRKAVDQAWQVARNGEPYDIEYRIVLDGAIRWLHSYAELELEADATQRRALGTVQDITERKRREEDLRHFRAAMDASADAIYLVDRTSMRFIDVNEAACRMQSSTHEELLALGPDGVLSVPRGELARTYDSIIAGGPGSEPVEMLRRRKDGTQVWVELRRRAQRSGERWIIVTTVRDITERKNAEQALSDSAEKLRMFADNVPALTVSWDENLCCRFANKAFTEFFGLAAEDILGKHVRDVLGEGVYLEIEGYFAQVMQGHPVTYQRTRKLPNGESRHIEVKLLPQIGDQGKILGCFAVTTDITEFKRAEQALRASAEQLRLFADNVPAMTASFDEKLHLVFVNKRYADFFGYNATEILGKHLREIVGERVYGEIEGHFAQVLQGHPVTYLRTRNSPNGECRYLEIRLLPHIGEKGKILGSFAVATDITDHVLAEERVQRMAHHDNLTGLPNRLLFNDRLAQTISLAKRDSRQFALLYLDLDKFKAVNDTLGHTAGDELLQAVADRIRHQLRESDTVARVGGDEFTVILPDIGRREHAETVARKIIASLAMRFHLRSEDQSADIGTSIGIAIYPEDAMEADALVKAADAAMYAAKQVGNSFRFCGADAGNAKLAEA